jgi:plasmid stabilization system protein ParE
MTSPIELVLSARARLDRTGILRYTYATWGEDQLIAYDQILEDAFDLIRQFPDIGHPIDGRPSNIREYVLRHHTIVYRRETERVVILRVVNPRRRR